jgi:hypothetical protein
MTKTASVRFAVFFADDIESYLRISVDVEAFEKDVWVVAYRVTQCFQRPQRLP